MPTALVIRHIAHEGLDGFEAPIRDAGFGIDIVDPATPAFDGTDLTAPDLLVVLGGPMAAYETDTHAWIVPEIERIAAGGPTLGICLGSQMIAAALGAHVHPGPVMEVGFAPIELSAAGRESPLHHVDGLSMLHWHGDTFDLPDGCERLAGSSHYANQAFRRDRTLLALQFHAEVTAGTLDLWIERADGYLEAAGTSGERLRADAERHAAAAIDAGRRMLAEWLDGLR